MLLLADPIILLAPNAHSNAVRWTNFYDYLIDCNDLIDTGTHDVVLSELCQDALYSSDRYPQHLQELQSWLSIAGITEFDAKTLITLIHTIAHNVPGLADKLDIQYTYDSKEPNAIWIETDPLILIEQHRIIVQPPIVLSRLEKEGDLAIAFHLTGGLIAYAANYLPLMSEVDLAILTIDEEQPDGQIDQINIQAVLYQTGEQNKEIQLSTVLSPKDLRDIKTETTSILKYWPDINGMFDYIHSSRNFIHLAPYRFADTFTGSLETMHLNDKGDEMTMILNRIHDLLTLKMVSDDPNAVFSPPVPTKSNHHIKHGNKQVQDGEWGAWRCHISGKEFRLHYWWRKSDKMFVISKIVGHHNDMSIDLNASDKIF